MKRPAPERTRGSLALSAAIHIAFGALVLWVLSIPAPLQQWLTPTRIESRGID